MICEVASVPFSISNIWAQSFRNTKSFDWSYQLFCLRNKGPSAIYSRKVWSLPNLLSSFNSGLHTYILQMIFENNISLCLWVMATNILPESLQDPVVPGGDTILFLIAQIVANHWGCDSPLCVLLTTKAILAQNGSGIHCILDENFSKLSRLCLYI